MNITDFLTVAGFIFLLGTIPLAEGQDCSLYTIITDSRRTTQEVFNEDTESPISDTDINPDNWYRFRSYVGNSIPERAVGDSVKMNRCGTNYPIYISGLDQHPTIDHETTTALVKVNDWQGEISIHKCPADLENESFFIYRLLPAPAEQTAYCAGEGTPCDDGYMYNGIECVDYFPMMKGQPIFSGPHTTGSNEMQQVYFTCKVQYDRAPGDTFARFMIVFVFDEYELEYIGPPHKDLPPFIVGPDGEISANLTEYYLQGRLGREIQCKVRAFWEENSEKGSALMSAEKYKATLEAVETFDFDFQLGAEQTISFNPTLPFTYFHCSSHECPLPFIYYFFLKTAVATEMDCSLRWKDGAVPQLVVYIKPFAGSRIFDVRFQPYDGDFHQDETSLWHNFVIPTVTIRAFESSDTVCKSLTDPHIVTFDGRDFTVYSQGDYYLVIAEADKYKLEVQVRQESCNNGASCNCGVIVREINSAVKVSYNQCDAWQSSTPRQVSVTRLLEQIPDDGTEITIDEPGRKFSIRLPSGSRLEVDATMPYFSIEVHLAPIYQGKTSVNSLCGNSNGNPDDDSENMPNFNITDPAKNFFKSMPDCNEDYYPTAKMCSCSESGTSVECTNVEQNITIKSPANNKLSSVWSSGVVCVAPGSSVLDQHNSNGNNGDNVLDPADLFPPFNPDPNAGSNISLTWPTAKGKKKEEVEEYCLNMLKQSAVYSDCNTVSNTNLTLQHCVSDIQIADEYIATTYYADRLGNECLNVLIVEENKYNSTSGGTPPTDDISTIYSKNCPAQCSGHGVCNNGTCICNHGYIGADCSIDETQPPVLTGIARGGICDIQQRPCATVSVFGYGVISAETLKCGFSDISVGSVLYTNGTFVTGSEVSCPVPNIPAERSAVSRQGISVSNDGVLHSNVLEFVTFDSVCMSCSQDKVCSQKTDSCLISDRCYANGAMKGTETCQQCSPSQSNSSWTDMPVIENVQPCSRTCDYGAQIKESVCTINNTVLETEPVLCQSSICPAIPEENLQGVILSLSNEDTTKILLTPTDILSQVAEVVNNYCSAHATECCNSVGISNGVSLSSFTSQELCSYGSGYPQVGDASSRTKVIVKIIKSQVQNECVEGVSQKSTDTEEAYANPDIIVTAVNDGKDVIEKALGITIVSVEKDSGSYTAAGISVAKHTSMILVTIVAAFMSTWMMIQGSTLNYSDSILRL